MTLNGKKVYDVSIEGESDDIQVMEAYWEDGTPLTDDELDELSYTCSMELDELWMERMIDKADYFEGE